MNEFEEAGACRIRDLLSRSELLALQRLNRMPPSRAGNRALLSLPWCKALAARMMSRLPQLSQLVAIQCTLFEKSAARNWLVAPHQDLSSPVAMNSVKGRATSDGLRITRADPRTLAESVAVRVHLDDCGANNGPLRMMMGSHRNGVLTQAKISESVRAKGVDLQIAHSGDAWMMSPLLIHASSKTTGNSRRRVLHFLFVPTSKLPA
jgi:ectoine hydroxylase-related dioxygenase (phytanoyl-CoA dioxygenase family)